MQAILCDMLLTTQVFSLPSKYNMADMLRADCNAADICYEDSGQGKVDFHSLRHTTGSLLAASGVHPKVAQTIMRHSDINLTMSRYTHTLRGQESEAVESLPDLSLPGKQDQKATGTDDSPVDSTYKPAYLDGQSLSTIGSAKEFENKSFNGDVTSDKPLQTSQLGIEKEPISPNDSTSNSNAPERIRTSDLRFRKPLLYPTELRAQMHYYSTYNRLILQEDQTKVEGNRMKVF